MSPPEVFSYLRNIKYPIKTIHLLNFNLLGFILNEIIRRVDPHGRTIREIVAEDIAKPLGLAETLHIGLPHTDDANQRYFMPFSPSLNEIEKCAGKLDLPEKEVLATLKSTRSLEEKRPQNLERKKETAFQ